MPLLPTRPICSPWPTFWPIGERRDRLEVDVVGDPAVAVVEVDAVVAAGAGEDLLDLAVGRGEDGLALAHVGVAGGPLAEVDAVLVGPVAVVGRGLPGLPAGEGHLEEGARAGGLGGRGGDAAGRRWRGRWPIGGGWSGAQGGPSGSGTYACATGRPCGNLRSTRREIPGRRGCSGVSGGRRRDRGEGFMTHRRARHVCAAAVAIAAVAPAAGSRRRASRGLRRHGADEGADGSGSPTGGTAARAGAHGRLRRTRRRRRTPRAARRTPSAARSSRSATSRC